MADYTAFNHKEWESAGLADFSDFSDFVEYRNERESGYGDMEGEWFYSPDTLVTDHNGDQYRVIYFGTHGNDHSPGASCYTHADTYLASDPEEMEQYRLDLARYENAPEYIGEYAGDNNEESSLEPDDIVMDGSDRLEYFVIDIPTDIVNRECKTFAVITRELCAVAINEVRERCDTYRMPCEWTASLIDGDILDSWEVTIQVIRRSNA